VKESINSTSRDFIMKILKIIAPYIAMIMSGVLLFSLLVVRPTQAQDARKSVIVVNAEQPNIWTLEQAHYLLAQMHRRNLDLKAKSLEDLDANEINGLRFDVMRMLIEFGATFNQADLVSNRLFSQNQSFNSERRSTLTAESDRLRKESVALTGEIDELENQKADATSDEEKARLDAKISSKKNRLARVDKETENVNGELKTLNVSGGELKATTGGAEFDPEKLPKSIFDDAFKEAAADQIKRFSQAPKLNASLRLDNFLEMQYEIIAKQLSLLRDELGPGERLVFLELPQSINVTHHEADKKWAQSWWKIAGYTKRVRMTETYSPRKNNTPPLKTEEAVKSILSGSATAAENDKYIAAADKAEYTDTFINLDKPQAVKGGDLQKYLETVRLSNGLVRTVELIPRQSSLNVSDMKLNVHAGAFNFVLSTLFGFGSQLNIQRQREQFAQFVQQELYSSAFGKGSREFGWTFTPMPGMDRLQSGVRTTYAIVVVPDNASSLILETNGCYFPRSAYPPLNFAETKYTDWNKRDRTSRNCGGLPTKAFLVPIPTSVEGSADFWVRRVDYQPVGKGKQIVVSLTGRNFSNQMGVLINGVALRHSIGLAQPLIRDDSTAGRLTEEEFKDAEVQGHIERVDAQKMVFTFKMPDDFEGTPTITLVAPGKAIDINWLDNISVNDDRRATLASSHPNACGNPPAANCVHLAPPMFSSEPPPELRIDRVEAFRQTGGNMNVLITGSGFDPNHTDFKMFKVFINGSDQPRAKVESATLISATIPAPTDDNIQVTLVADEKTLNAEAVVNPLQLKIDKVRVVSYEPASKGNAGVLVVRIEGRGFNSGLQSSPRKVRLNVASSTEAYLTIPNPNQTEVVTLHDPTTRIDVSTVIGRKPPE
jgi:hypothetical protein